MAVSAQQPAPSQERLLLLVEDAYRLWREIPDVEIPGAVEAAIIEAGSFIPTAGLVVKCWRGGKEKLHLGDGVRKDETETQKYLEHLRQAGEEKADPEFVSEFCGRVIAKLEGNPASREMV